MRLLARQELYEEDDFLQRQQGIREGHNHTLAKRAARTGMLSGINESRRIQNRAQYCCIRSPDAHRGRDSEEIPFNITQANSKVLCSRAALKK